MKEQLYQVRSSGTLNAGVVVNANGLITETARVLKWAQGRRIDWFATQCAGRNWILRKLANREPGREWQDARRHGV